MSGQDHPPSIQSWLAPAIVALLGIQLGLLYLNGFQIHQQRWDILELKHEVQDLTYAIEQGASEDSMETPGGVPIHRFSRHAQRRPSAFRRVVLEEETEPAINDLETTRKSAQKAVKDSREIQQKLSIEENVRKSEEKARVQAEQNRWQKYVGLGLALTLVAVFTRSYLRRRG
jgi:hypothetical protein